MATTCGRAETIWLQTCRFGVEGVGRRMLQTCHRRLHVIIIIFEAVGFFFISFFSPVSWKTFNIRIYESVQTLAHMVCTMYTTYVLTNINARGKKIASRKEKTLRIDMNVIKLNTKTIRNRTLQYKHKKWHVNVTTYIGSRGFMYAYRYTYLFIQVYSAPNQKGNKNIY